MKVGARNFDRTFPGDFYSFDSGIQPCFGKWHMYVLIPEHLNHHAACTGIGKVKHGSNNFLESDLLVRTSRWIRE